MSKTRNPSLILFAALIVGMSLLTGAGQAQTSHEQPYFLEYVPPLPGLVKLYYRINPDKPSQRVFTDVGIMDETRDGLTGFYLYAGGRDEWTFQRLLTACDFFSVYREIDGQLSTSLSELDALDRCSQTWPLRAGDVVTMPGDTVLTIDRLTTETLMINGVASDRQVYMERRDTEAGDVAMRYSAQGVGTYRIDIKDGPTFGADLMVFDHRAQGHILGRCMESGSIEACLCVTNKAPIWLQSDTLDAVVAGVQLAWTVETLEPVVGMVEMTSTEVEGLRRQSIAACDADLSVWVY